MQIKTKAGRTINMPSPEEDAAITAATISDPDSQPLTDAEWAALRPRQGRPTAPTSKTRITIRIDSDIVAIYKAHAAKQGTSYQPSINAVLRQHAEEL
jgi:uncharacterized protein (DUF4415 family)